MADQFTIVVPWFQRSSFGTTATGDGTDGPRSLAFGALVNHLIDAELSYVVSPPLGEWSRAAARNAGALTVTQPVVVFNDADTIVSPEQIRRAAWQAIMQPGLVYAYDLYLRLTRESSESMMRGEQPHWPVPEREILNAPSMGCAAISLECFRAVGGFDEAYVGWGYEDVDFANRCAERWPLRRVPGPAFHLWHGERDPRTDMPHDADLDEAAANEARLNDSSEARGRFIASTLRVVQGG